MIDTRKLKDKATEAFAKGKFSKAAEFYEQVCAADPKDLQARLRMGDAFSKSGSKDKAIKAYQGAAETFAKDGFLPRAIAASKLILELDPTHTGVQQMLAELYARRSAPASGERKREVAAPTLIHPGSRPSVIELPADAAPPQLKASAADAVDAESDDEGVALDVESTPGAVDLSDELPPELAADLAPPAPARSAPAAPAPVQASAPPPADQAEPEVEIDIDLAEPAPAPVAPVAAAASPAPVAPVAAVASAAPVAAAPVAPPGLRPKRPGNVNVVAAAPAPPGLAPSSRAPAPAAPPPASASASRFAELDLDMAPAQADIQVLSASQLGTQGDSLLHAVEAAALAGLGDEAPALQSGHEETAFSTEDLAEPVSPNALPKIPLFSDLPPDAFIELFERCQLRRFARDELILQQGTQGSSFFVICEGSVSVVREDGKERKALAILNEGAFFGEMALLSDAPRTASVVSHAEETQLLEISAQVLAELSRRYPPVAQALKKFCRQRMLSNVMNTSAMFQPFSRGDRKQLVERFRARDVRKDDVIIREGDRTDGLYVLLSGEVEVSKSRQSLARLKEGDIFGEMSLLQKTPATATVTATKRTSLLRLPREDFNELILSHPQILMLVAELTEDRKRRTEAMLSGAATNGGEALVLV